MPLCVMSCCLRLAWEQLLSPELSVVALPGRRQLLAPHQRPLQPALQLGDLSHDLALSSRQRRCRQLAGELCWNTSRSQNAGRRVQWH